jgi:isocitrate/isopropylmalate dehydrogenase
MNVNFIITTIPGDGVGMNNEEISKRIVAITEPLEHTFFELSWCDFEIFTTAQPRVGHGDGSLLAKGIQLRK